MYFCSHQQLQLAEWVFIHTQEWGNCRKLKICLADGLPASTKAAGLVYLVYLAGKPKSRPVGALLYVDLWLQNPSGWTKCLGLSGKTLMILLWCCIMLHPFFFCTIRISQSSGLFQQLHSRKWQASTFNGHSPCGDSEEKGGIYRLHSNLGH